MVDKYPADLLAEIRSLRADVEGLKSQLRQRSALTSASQGWIIPNNAADSDDIDDGGHIGASGNEPFWTEASGETYSLKPTPPPPPPTPAPAPNWPESFSSPASIGSAPTASDYNLLRSDCAGLHDDLRAVILRGAEFGAWLDPS